MYTIEEIQSYAKPQGLELVRELLVHKLIRCGYTRESVGKLLNRSHSSITQRYSQSTAPKIVSELVYVSVLNFLAVHDINTPVCMDLQVEVNGKFIKGRKL